MRKVLVSSCLVGDPVRYDGTAATCSHPVLEQWLREARIIPHCPEIAGGLGTPRSPVELTGGDGEAVLKTLARARGPHGEDVTAAFIAGAMATVSLCQRLGILVAVLKERSPSCGSSSLYDGTFSGLLIAGPGVTTAALRAHGVSVFSEAEWELAEARLAELERSAVMGATPVHPIDILED
jgi:uncharacterized protein YbbK (DUF523 family)